ncbi:MAG: hypothetical protein JKY86_00105 [Gammaproteobacteria bacterium]|nr:hypothetical protein [Gammaproteobacteria bacterium]
MAKQAADILHMSTAGVDLISTDITVPWYDNGAAINEMNFSPSWRDHKELLREGRIKFLEKTFPTQGRIPVHVFVGDEAAKQAAQTHHAARIDAGQRAYLVCGDRVYGPAGLKPLSFQEVSVFLRTKALCLHSDVDELILSVHSTEFLTTGLPVDRISSLTVTNHSLSMHLAPGRAATQNEIASLIKALEKTLLEEK